MLATWGTSTGFNPASLFSGGEQGAWYDPSDNLTMFQDAQGTTAVTAVEQAVGLILDKRNGLGIGTEVISNNTFDSDTVWSKGTGWSIGSGVATKTAGSAANLSQTVTLVAGTTYRLVYTITRTAGSITPQFSGGSTVSGTARSAAGTYVENLTAVSGNTTFEFAADATFAGTVDNVYLKRVSGNDAYQTTSASRPTLRARYNLLTYSEEFDNAAWSILNAAIIKDSTVAPDGTTTADTFNVTDASSVIKRTQQVASPVPTGANTFSVYVKAGTQNFVQLYCTGDFQAFANFDVSAGTVGTAGTKTTASIQNVGNGWYRCVAVFDATTVYTGATFRIAMQTSASAVYNGSTPNTGTFFLWGAQLVQNAVFPSNVYQRIAAATVYDTGAAFPQYLSFDGTDDSLLTTSVDFTGTDKMTVFSGASKLSDATSAMFLELSSQFSANNGAFALQMPGAGGGPSIVWNSKGTVSATATYSNAAVAAPVTIIHTAIGDISVDSCISRVNAAQVASSATDQGTGNYGAFPLYIGRRNNATLPFNGRIYSLIVRGAASNSTQIAQAERYVAAKTPLGVVP
jgi:hypothetical protein